MRPRAFVVMPFNKKPSARADVVIDFNAVYEHLFQPALEQAGYEVVRADSERSAGDIRTDMFFELVTADLVVADVSILNGNVFYELGVRHGVCPSGVFVVGNDSMRPPSFDIAPDLSRYSAAKRVLGDVIRLNPDDANAKIQLAMVLSKLDEIPTAEHELRKLSRDYKGQPQAANSLGQVFRHLWHLSWQQQEDTSDGSARREKARDASHLALSHTQWLINTAEMEAEPATSVFRPAPDRSEPAGGRLHGVFLWNGDAAENQAFLIQRVNRFNGYRAQVHIIHPTKEE